ncbi:metal-dependent hydrolase [Sneathiella sp. HT1-7]|uniref:metal-dependent hydrolase n=1 Tax=Sneathiella sp. HT1-7 TaxID=2887192 RepID=UPI001D137A77|nr:metal-dependent hydrolase [Sneathiella sp. HT1-7]MCC3303328.1 metal-dependent hydrolase [Sneathiella sp. HT1-7]
MDSVTQFVLGASISGALLGPRIGPKALLIGGIVATLPDLDSFVPLDDAIDNMTYHRGFSHSVIVQTVLSPLIALAIGKIAPSSWQHKKILFLTVWLALITHSLLDSLTTYGTQIFWPLNVGPPVALPAVFIIDPIYTLLLLIGIATIFLARNKPGGGFRINRIMLALSCAYLAIGLTGNTIISSRASADPLLRDMRIHVQPTAFNLLVWQVTAISEEKISTGLTSLINDCGIRNLVTVPRQQIPHGIKDIPPSVKRLEWFTDGFYSYGERDGAQTITDLRMGFYPNYVFSFKFAENSSDNIVIIPPERISLSYEERAGEIFSLVSETLKGCDES